MLDPGNGQLILGKWQTVLELTSNRALSKFILIEINLMRMPLEERNTSIKTRIEKRKATVSRKDAELKQAAEELVIQEQKVGDLTFALEMAKVQRPRGTRIPKGKTTDEIIADDKIFEHARKL
jgi:hypothetical protein